MRDNARIWRLGKSWQFGAIGVNTGFTSFVGAPLLGGLKASGIGREGSHLGIDEFLDGESALMLIAARLRHIATTKWGTRRYLNLELLNELQESDTDIA